MWEFHQDCVLPPGGNLIGVIALPLVIGPSFLLAQIVFLETIILHLNCLTTDSTTDRKVLSACKEDDVCVEMRGKPLIVGLQAHNHIFVCPVQPQSVPGVFQTRYETC